MNNQDYEQKRRECWEEFCKTHNPGLHWPAFEYAFDRAYALGKHETEQISPFEEEIHTYAKMCSVTEEDYIAIRKAIEFGIELANSDKQDSINLKKLDKMLDEALEKETTESLSEFLDRARMEARIKQ